jgi:acetyltransferase-like isoleucine patch superfamily enzyme
MTKFNGQFKVGDNVNFGPSNVISSPDFFYIGNDFSSGRNFFVQTNVSIGDECLISSDVSFVGHDHYLNEKSMSAYFSGKAPASKVILKGNNFIGYGAVILGNVELGEGAVVAAGAVVTKNVEPFSVVAGVPAKHIKNRF